LCRKIDKNYDMKKLFFFVQLCLPLFWACKNDKKSEANAVETGPVADMVHNAASATEPFDSNSMARIRFDEPEFDFGQATEGEVVYHKFKFTNTGKVPLTILKARSTCGCTVPEWPSEPIPPGGTGEIEAKFNTEGKTKDQKKVITVTANTYPSDTKVTIKGIVNGK
jgi:Protein of unknown function (DUF1573)